MYGTLVVLIIETLIIRTVCPSKPERRFEHDICIFNSRIGNQTGLDATERLRKYNTYIHSASSLGYQMKIINHIASIYLSQVNFNYNLF